jgi:hypothetical protein
VSSSAEFFYLIVKISGSGSKLVLGDIFWAEKFVLKLIVRKLLLKIFEIEFRLNFFGHLSVKDIF